MTASVYTGLLVEDVVWVDLFTPPYVAGDDRG